MARHARRSLLTVRKSFRPVVQAGRALPCVGLDALGAGLLEMNWDAFEVVYAYNIDASLAAALFLMHGQMTACFHIGHHGDPWTCNAQA